MSLHGRSDRQEEVDDERLAQPLCFALKQNRKAIVRLQPTDDAGFMAVARRFVAQLRLSGIITVKERKDLGGASVLRGPHEASDQDRS